MKRCKRDGKNRNNLDVVNEDRISELPDALILQILSLLPTEEAIATSVLSKQWQSHWKMLPKLKFDSHDHHFKVGTFTKNVYKVLLSREAPVLQSLHLRIRLNLCTEMGTGELIGVAVARNVRKLVLQVLPVEYFRFPKSFYNCETLETLKLKFTVLIDVPSTVCLKSLKTLHLYYVDFKDKNSLFNLLSGCPNLENLLMHRYPFISTSVVLGTFTISVPSLKRLTIYYSNGLRHDGYVIINAPSLKYLKIEENCGHEFCPIENVTKLVEANLINFSQKMNENFLRSLTSVKRLSLELSPHEIIMFPTASIFYQLEYLELYTNYEAWWNLLTLMLDSSPKLKVLKLNDPLYIDKDLRDPGNFYQPKNVPECLLFHLETFLWEGYQWEREEEKELGKYILGNANRLRRAIFFSKTIDPKERVEMVKDLNSVVRASNSCQLLVE